MHISPPNSTQLPRRLCVHTLNPETTDLLETELPLSAEAPECSLRLRALPGASALHLALTDGGTVRLQAEIPADENETVLVRLELLDGERLTISSPGRHVLTLPPDERYAPPSPIPVPPSGAPADLALVIDGTARAADGSALLADTDAWPAHVEQLLALLEALLAKTSDARFAVVAFGDDPPPQAKAVDLLPRYRLFPGESEISLQSLGLDALRELLLGLPPSSGGDFVDAVADALAACRRLRWRPEARKLVILTGDSPGHSILHPAPPGGDARVRELDVDHEALRLHHQGVELVTLYHEPASEELQEIDFKQQLVEFARVQFRRLASRPEMAFVTSTLDPSGVAEIIHRQQERVLGREAAWGELSEILCETTLD